MTTLLIADRNNAVLQAATLNCATAATRLGGDVHVLVAGANAGPAAQAAAKIAGVAKVLHADAAHLGQPTAESVAATVVALVKAGNYSHVLAPATGFGKNVSPRVAALLDVPQIPEITAIETPDTFVRPIYAGAAFATVQSKDPVKVITVRATAFDAAGTGGSAAVESVTAAPDTGLSKVTGQELTKSDSKRFEEVVTKLREAFDIVTFDSAPLQLVSDSLVLSSYASAVIYVVKADATPYQVAQNGLKRLRRVDAPILGVVLNQLDLEKAEKYCGEYSGYRSYKGYRKHGYRGYGKTYGQQSE